MVTIEEIILAEENKLSVSIKPNDSLNILFNLITLKNTANQKIDNYKNIKLIINYYVEVVKTSNYGYDNFNFQKIEKLIKLLTYKEQIRILQYAISVITRELSEFNKEWFITRKHQAEIDDIIFERRIQSYPKAFLMSSGLNFPRLLIVLFSFFLIINVILLPSQNERFSIFSLTYENYSNCFLLNHILNIFSFFADIDNEFTIQALNWFGLVLLVLGKVTYILLFINFIYRKISDKISLK